MRCDRYKMQADLSRSLRRSTLIVLVLLAPAWGQKNLVRDPGTYVVDQAGVIQPADKQQLESVLRELQDKTTAQVKVLTVQTTGGEDFFTFVQRHAEAWKLGQKGKDNGALIVLALKEREVRIHTGYGLESVLPDSWSGSVSRSVAAQYFKQEQYSAGLRDLTLAVAGRVAEASGIQLSGMPAGAPRIGPSGAGAQRGGRGNACCCFVAVVVALLIFSAFGRSFSYNRGGGRWWPWMLLWMLMSSGRRQSHWGGGGIGRGFGGGFGGGGFGGGSFGGGGRFGGGGGGARW